LELRQQMKNKAEIASSLTSIGLLYRNLGLNGKALNYFSQALEERLQSGSSIEIGDAYTHLGNAYFDVKKFKEALDSYKKALSYREKAKDNTLKARSLNSIATAYQMLGNNREAESNFSKALILYQSNRDDKGLAIVRNNLGNFYLAQNKRHEALTNFYIASKINKATGNKLAEGLCYRKIGEIYLSQNLTGKADSALKASLALGIATRNFEHLKNTYLALYNLALKNNDIKQALSSYIAFSQYQDSIAKTKTSEELMDARLTMELDRKKSDIQKIENEIEILRKEALLQESELRQQRYLRIFLVSISLVLIAFGFVLLRANRLKKQKTALLQERFDLVNSTNEKLAKSESELITLNQTKDKFFSIIAHDLKNPFNALMGFSELLKENAASLSTQEVVSYGQTINDASQRLYKLLENLLQWARTQTGKIPFTPTTFPINEAISQNINLQELNAASKSISLEVETIESFQVFADWEMVNTVLRNLISNAIKFTPPKGRVAISTVKKADKVEVSISDSGIGMSEEDRQKLFRIDVHYTTKGTNEEEGTGLGLIICKEFIEKQGGEIWVSSTQGVGTTFFFTLPINK
ncbi:MAG TPA: tetratricopeptide repeat-containing sensor histidine kinase, partial [Williamwhitmania sp.]|nr:tetratricopeptide repeat-containing sensor histidine kinase [Williamwhitmania sp.]